MSRRWGWLCAAVACILMFAAGCAPATAVQPDSSGEPHRAAARSRTAQQTEAPKQTAEVVPLFTQTPATEPAAPAPEGSFDYSEVPAYSDEPYVAVNDNIPFFTAEEALEPPAAASLGTEPGAGQVRSFEAYSNLDELGRCGPAVSAVGLDIMPTEKRGSISEVHPSGWVQAKYDFVDGEALYNRCHLLGYQLTAENANPYNLITGTRYMNTQGMLPFENMVADYVKETGNHVLYRVTPVFVDDELVARGVLMEAQSVEDDGDGVEYAVFAYNVQPGVGIDYQTGESWLAEPQKTQAPAANAKVTYVLNTSSMRFHKPDCTSVDGMSASNREDFSGTRKELVNEGYEPCGNCKP